MPPNLCAGRLSPRSLDGRTLILRLDSLMPARTSSLKTRDDVGAMVSLMGLVLTGLLRE